MRRFREPSRIPDPVPPAASAPGRDSLGGAVDRHPKRRDRHGRGIRGSLAPVGVPLARTRPERFDDFVLDAVEQVERAVKDDAPLSQRLAVVEYGVEEVPPEQAIAAASAGEPVALARTDPATSTSPPRVVVYRRPLELRAPDPRDREALVHEVLVDRLADLLGVAIDQLDPPPPD